MALVICLFCSCGNTEKANKFNDVAATEIVNSMGVGLNLGNTMEAYNASNCEKNTYTWIPQNGSNQTSDYEMCWGASVTTQEMIDGIKAAGFSTVRIPVFWGNMMENDDTYTINSEYIGRVKEIVDYCFNDDLYVVINIHHFDEFIIRRNSTEKCKEIFTTLWTQIGDYFNSYSEKLIFEGYNEYLGGEVFDENGKLSKLTNKQAYEMTNTLNQAFVDAVRSTGGNNAKRVLIVSGYWTNIDLTTADEFIVPTDTAENKLMVSVHYVDNAMYWMNKIGTDEWLNYIDEQCDKLTKSFTSKGIPVFLGETTGMYPKSNFASNATYTDSSECLKIVLDKLTDCGFVPVIWDTPNGFYSRNLCKLFFDSDASVITYISEKLSNK